jgi:hypothetical protein
MRLSPHYSCYSLSRSLSALSVYNFYILLSAMLSTTSFFILESWLRSYPVRLLEERSSSERLLSKGKCLSEIRSH